MEPVADAERLKEREDKLPYRWFTADSATRKPRHGFLLAAQFPSKGISLGLVKAHHFGHKIFLKSFYEKTHRFP